MTETPSRPSPSRWPIAVPYAAAAALIAASVAYVLPALADADRADIERARFESTARALRGSSAAASDLLAERDRLSDRVHALVPALDAETLELCRIEDGLLHLELRGDFAALDRTLHAIDHASCIAVRSVEIALVEPDGPADGPMHNELRLFAVLEPIGIDPASVRAVAHGPAGVSGATDEGEER
jgi:hypothetical protein